MFDPAEELSPALADAAFCQRVANYLDGDVGAAEIQLLNAELLADASKQAAFVRLCLVRSILISDGISDLAMKGLRSGAASADDFNDDLDPLGVSADPRGHAAGASLYDAMILPALRDEESDGRAIAVVRRAPSLPQPVPPSGRTLRLARPRWSVLAITAAAAAGVALVTIPAFRSYVAPGVGPLPRPRVVAVTPKPKPAVPPTVALRPSAVISAVAGAVLKPASVLTPGTALVAGQALDLRSGAIEVTFDDGAVVVVSAPARMRVVDRGDLALDAGSVAAHVPPRAVGFRVDAPNLSVIDRGTDFGVRANDNGAGTVVNVFKGAVDASAVKVGTPATAPTADRTAEQTVRVTAGHAVAELAGDPSPPRATAYEPSAFVRSIDSYRVPVALHGTAADVSFEQADPNWTMVAGPVGTGTYPAPAYAVALPLNLFVHTTPAAKWISTTPRRTDAVPEGNFTFRTTVSLPDFAPKSLSIRADWAADDWIVDIVVNGVGTAKANAAVVGRSSRTQPLSWDLRGAPWHAGDNQVDVVVWNKAVGNMALKLSWAATLCPVVRR